MGYQGIQVPATNDKITVNADISLSVPKDPIISFIEGDGIGVDISPVMIKVVDAAMERAYESGREVAWIEVYAGEKVIQVCDQDTWLPQETLDTVRNYVVSIKGPLTILVGSGIRSLNVVPRQQPDLYACQRPVHWFEGVPNPIKKPGDIDMVVFRENSEGIYAGVEWKAGSPEVEKVIKFLTEKVGVKKIRFTENCDTDIKPVPQEDTERLMCKTLRYAVDNDRSSAILVHKGSVMKFTEGVFKDWGYEVAHGKFGAGLLGGGPWMQFESPKTGENVVVEDVITDVMLQQILLRLAEYDMIATLDLSGDYLSGALAAEVGGIGIAPGANLSDSVAMFEVTHGTMPRCAGQDKVNPGPLILSVKVMLRHVGWTETADLIIKGTNGTIAAKTVTYDFEHLMDGTALPSCSEFGDTVITKI